MLVTPVCEINERLHETFSPYTTYTRQGYKSRMISPIQGQSALSEQKSPT
jgi:hypothetical protein